MKKWLKSKTINFGLLVTVFGAIQANLPYVQMIFSPVEYGVLTALIGVGIVVLRYYTNGSLDDK